VVPEHYHSMCCGQPFESQGYQTAAAHVRNTILQEIARTGRVAITHVLTDTGTCAAALNSVVDATDIVVLTPVQWLLTFVLPNISIQQLPWDVLVYEGCSQSKLHETAHLANVLHGLVRGVHFSSTEYCCGMAGIHGIRYPEVPRRALESVFADTRWDAIQAIITTNTLCSYAIAKNGPVPSYTLLELAAMAAGLCSIPHPRNT
jgi:D-lactate dehydrogenase